MNVHTLKGSYDLLFIVAIIISIFYLLSTIFYYDKFEKAENKRLSPNDAAVAKQMTLVSLVIAILSVLILVGLYFGSRTQLASIFKL